MKKYQRQFLDLAIESTALRFGEFKLKSGRTSPYFFNTGFFNTGTSLYQLGRIYAQSILAWGGPFDILFGPAYKGISLVCATAIALSDSTAVPVPYCFNRKEVKDHGEGGHTIGAPLRGQVLILDDVISSGLSISESVSIIRSAQAEPRAVFVALDRKERGEHGSQSAIDEVRERYTLDVQAIVTVTDLMDYLGARPELRKHIPRIQEYQSEYGA